MAYTRFQQGVGNNINLKTDDSCKSNIVVTHPSTHPHTFRRNSSQKKFFVTHPSNINELDSVVTLSSDPVTPHKNLERASETKYFCMA